MRTIAQIADLTRLKHYGDLMDAAMLMARAVNDEAQWLIKHREFHETINRVIAEGIRADRRQRGRLPIPDAIDTQPVAQQQPTMEPAEEKHMRVSDKKGE